MPEAKRPVLHELDDLAVLAASGPDVDRFLQNQFTADLRALAPAKSLLGGYCSPQGRLVAVFRLVRRADAVWMVLPAPVMPVLRERLLAYRLRSRVALDDATAGLARLGVAGAGADVGLAGAGIVPPPNAGDANAEPDLTIVRAAGAEPRFLLLGSAERVAEIRGGLSAAALGSGVGWRRHEIEAGQPAVYAETVETFLPQMLNLDALSGLSFTKGCFPGQEVVARLRYLGQLKRRMVLAHAVASRSPSPGDPIHGRGGVVGKVVDAAYEPGRPCALLAVVQLANVAEEDPLHLWDADGPLLALRPLPYEIPPAIATTGS